MKAVLPLTEKLVTSHHISNTDPSPVHSHSAITSKPHRQVEPAPHCVSQLTQQHDTMATAQQHHGNLGSSTGGFPTGGITEETDTGTGSNIQISSCLPQNSQCEGKKHCKMFLCLHRNCQTDKMRSLYCNGPLVDVFMVREYAGKAAPDTVDLKHQRNIGEIAFNWKRSRGPLQNLASIQMYEFETHPVDWIS